MLRTLLCVGAVALASSSLAQPPAKAPRPAKVMPKASQPKDGKAMHHMHDMQGMQEMHQPPSAPPNKDDMANMVPAPEAEMKRPAQSTAEAMPKEMNMQSCMMHCERMMGMGGPLNIESNWDRFDEGGKGYLTPLEFGKWVMETNGQNTRPVDASKRSRKANLPAVELLNATERELARVDTNKDWRVTRDELSAIAE